MFTFQREKIPKAPKNIINNFAVNFIIAINADKAYSIDGVKLAVLEEIGLGT